LLQKLITMNISWLATTLQLHEITSISISAKSPRYSDLTIFYLSAVRHLRLEEVDFNYCRPRKTQNASACQIAIQMWSWFSQCFPLVSQGFQTSRQTHLVVRAPNGIKFEEDMWLIIKW